MKDDAASKQEILSNMAHSRAEIRRLLEPAPRVHHNDGSAGVGDDATSGTFPRSRIMRLLLSGKGMGTASAVVGGLLISRPALAFKLLRMLPTGAVARMLLIKAVTALRSRN